MPDTLPNGKYRGRYRPAPGEPQLSRVFDKKKDAVAWENAGKAAAAAGRHVDPATLKLTVGEWCDIWLSGYDKRPLTVRQAEVHIALIKKEFGHRLLREIEPSSVKTWMKKLRTAGYAPSYIYALHRRLVQIFGDAVHDGKLSVNPASRKTSPPKGTQKPYVATPEQVWALYEAFPPHQRVAVLLGAFAGLRTNEAVGLRITDVNFPRRYIQMAVQGGGDKLKSTASEADIPLDDDMALELSASIAAWGGDYIVTDGLGGQSSTWALERTMRRVRKAIPGLPETFTFHDLRHYFASALIDHGLDVKRVQALMRHASAQTTLETYGHLWKDEDDKARAAVKALFATRPAPMPGYPVGVPAEAASEAG